MILLFVQHESGKVTGATLSALAAARELQKQESNQGIVGLALGGGAAIAAQAMLPYGLSKSYYCEGEVFEKFRPVAFSPQIAKLAKEIGATWIVVASTSVGKDVAPRVAAELDAGQASDVLGILPGGLLKRPLFAGNLFAEVEISTAIKVITVRTTAFSQAQETSAVGQVEQFTAAAVPPEAGEVVGYEIAKAERPELTEARVVVSGGRALGSAEKFSQVLYPLADTLHAAVGASRAAVDSGYAPNDWQVGQTGKVVAPTLYFAIGISGQIQHLAGMKDSKTIVAINKNPEEPIFQVADYGLVADLFQAVPALVDELKKNL